MRVLVTNDDGVEAPGLHALASALSQAGHDVFVVAPSGERSGSGAAIGRLHRAGPIVWTPVQWPHLPGITVNALDVPPAAAVYAACVGAFGPAPHVVASGLNPGLNTGHLVLHSGTIGAALTGAALGVSGVAVSQAWGDEQQWDTAAAVAVDAVEWIGGLEGKPLVANVNVPNIALEELRGVRDARLCPFNERWEAHTTPGELHLSYLGHQDAVPQDSDAFLVKSGYVTITLLEGMATVPRVASEAATSIAQALETRIRHRGVA